MHDSFWVTKSYSSHNLANNFRWISLAIVSFGYNLLKKLSADNSKIISDWRARQAYLQLHYDIQKHIRLKSIDQINHYKIWGMLLKAIGLRVITQLRDRRDN